MKESGVDSAVDNIILVVVEFDHFPQNINRFFKQLST